MKNKTTFEGKIFDLVRGCLTYLHLIIVGWHCPYKVMMRKGRGGGDQRDRQSHRRVLGISSHQTEDKVLGYIVQCFVNADKMHVVVRKTDGVWAAN